jgi:hypothetical protein
VYGRMFGWPVAAALLSVEGLALLGLLRITLLEIPRMSFRCIDVGHGE